MQINQEFKSNLWLNSLTKKYKLVVVLFIILLFANTKALAINNSVDNNNNNLIVITIKPLYNLVAAVANSSQNINLKLLLSGNVSPHDYALKLTDVNMLARAKLIVWGGDQLEHFLAKLLQQPKFQSRLLTIQDLSGLKKLNFRNCNYLDEHWWLSPNNAKFIVLAVENFLIRLDPANTSLYQNNRKKFLIKLAMVDKLIKEKLSLKTNKNYLVFHDAYQYFEKFYNLKAPIVISDNPAMPLSLQRTLIVRELIDKNKANCIFKEPQFSSKALDSLIKSAYLNQKVKIGILDPIGSDNDLGSDGYLKLINNLADSFYSCFQE